MRKIVLFMHVSLDGFVAGPNGEMDWIQVDDKMFDYAGKRTKKATTALYGRVTYEMMNAYWPNAADQPNATKHDIEHSTWYNKVRKVVVSKTMAADKLPKTTVIGNNFLEEINQLRQSKGKEIIMFGSPSVAHSLIQENLVDDYWLFVNPILIGQGIPLFKDLKNKTFLSLKKSTTFSSGVVCLHYEKMVD